MAEKAIEKKEISKKQKKLKRQKLKFPGRRLQELRLQARKRPLQAKPELPQREKLLLEANQRLQEKLRKGHRPEKLLQKRPS